MHNLNAKDEIRISGLEIFAYHGVYAEETKSGQTFIVNATLYADTGDAGKADQLELSTNYGEVCHFINDWMKQNTCKLLEAVAEKMTRAILLKFPLVSSIDLEICKPDAPINLPFSNVSVKIHRGWRRAYLAVGSNMGDKKGYIDGAIVALDEHPMIGVRKVSELIETEPYGYENQDIFLNGAIEIETLLTPYELLDVLHEIEQAADRKREIHWGPRTLDLDILLFEDLVLESEKLTIPHADMANRAFVLQPLAEIAPGAVHPVCGKTITQLKQEL